MTEQENIVRTALDAAQEPFLNNDYSTPIMLIPMGGGAWKHQLMPELRTTPERKKGNVYLHQLESFLDFIKEHKEQGTQITVEADYAANKVRFKATINGHTGSTAGFGDFCVYYTPVNTVDWTNWISNNSKKMNQEDFARFLQDNIAAISNQNPAEPARIYPAAAALLEFASNLEMTTTVKFRSSTRVQNGQV